MMSFFYNVTFKLTFVKDVYQLIWLEKRKLFKGLIKSMSIVRTISIQLRSSDPYTISVSNLYMLTQLTRFLRQNIVKVRLKATEIGVFLTRFQKCDAAFCKNSLVENRVFSCTIQGLPPDY